MSIKTLIIVIVFSLCFASNGFPACDATKLEVVVSILPQKYFLEKIGGECVNVNVMIPPGANPVTYDPRPTQIKSISRAKVYFSIGVPFEQIWLKRFKGINPTMKVININEGIKLYPISAQHDVHKGMLDPHTWLAPHLVAIEARNILNALKGLLPEKRELLERNYSAFLDEIKGLDLRLMNILSKLKAHAFLVFHPSWGYFARAYGLKQIAIEKEGKSPSSRHLIELSKIIKRHHITKILVQPQFPSRYAQALAQSLGLKVLIADPLSLDWGNNLEKVASSLVNQ